MRHRKIKEVTIKSTKQTLVERCEVYYKLGFAAYEKFQAYDYGAIGVENRSPASSNQFGIDFLYVLV